MSSTTSVASPCSTLSTCPTNFSLPSLSVAYISNEPFSTTRGVSIPSTVMSTVKFVIVELVTSIVAVVLSFPTLNSVESSLEALYPRVSFSRYCALTVTSLPTGVFV